MMRVLACPLSPILEESFSCDNAPDRFLDTKIPISPDINLMVQHQIEHGHFNRLVFKTLHVEKNKSYVIKLLPNNSLKDRRARDREFEMLDKVTKYSQSVKYFVRVCAFRDWMDHSVVVMEMMDSDLKSFQRRQNIRALELRFIHKMALQMFSSLAFLHRIGVFHCDLKPDHFLISTSRTGDVMVKLTDFSSSHVIQDAPILQGKPLQSVKYRAPEVVWGTELNESIDIWSLGLILIELYTGFPFFDVSTDFELVCRQTKMFGFPSKLKGALFRGRYLVRIESQKEKKQSFRLTSYEEYLKAGGVSINTRIKRQVNMFQDVKLLEQLIEFGYSTKTGQTVHSNEMRFIELIENLLKISPSDRLCAKQALSHPFFDLHTDL